MPGSKAHILVVDDNEYNRELLVQDLEDSGYQVQTAASGIEALELIEHNLPQMVLLDIMMPGLSGIQVCQILRSKHRTQDLPIIMVTAKADSQDVVAGLHAGANDYVTKPIDIDVLFARMQTHLKLRELQTESRRQSERLYRELAAARSVQESLLPKPERLEEMPGSYGLDVAALWRPSETLGGDFWDLVSLADGTLGILLIDFAGCGVVPALNTFRIKTFLQGQCTGLYNAMLTTARINAHLMLTLSKWELATCIYARYNPDRCQFTVTSAGLPYPLVYRIATDSVEIMRVSGQPVGAFSDAVFDEMSVGLEEGDKIVFYTDGLLKCRNEEGGLYPEGRLRDLIAEYGAHSPQNIVDVISKDVDAFIGSATRPDDLTAIVMQVVN